MGEIPEHLLKRAAERKAQLEAEAAGGSGADAPSSAASSPSGQDEPKVSSLSADASSDTPAPAPADASSDAPASAPAQEAAPVRTGLAAKVPEFLFQRSASRRAHLSGDAPAAASGGGGGATAPAPGVPAPGAPVMQGPDGHTHRLLTVVKSGSIQQTKAEAQDKVHTWPHLVSSEFAAMLIVSANLFLFSMLVRAPLLGLADINQTPNPSKAPWYFLGLQELLTMFHPMVAGVTIPGVALVLLALTPYYDRNPSNIPDNRKFAIVMMTFFLVFWAVLVIIGSFFRGPGFNFVFPMKDGIFFEL